MTQHRIPWSAENDDFLRSKEVCGGSYSPMPYRLCNRVFAGKDEEEEEGNCPDWALDCPTVLTEMTFNKTWRIFGTVCLIGKTKTDFETRLYILHFCISCLKLLDHSKACKMCIKLRLSLLIIFMRGLRTSGTSNDFKLEIQKCRVFVFSIRHTVSKIRNVLLNVVSVCVLWESKGEGGMVT